MTPLLAFFLVCAVLFSRKALLINAEAPTIDIHLGMFQVEGGEPINLTDIAELLLRRLDPENGVLATNFTLGSTSTTSFHMFATNRTEPCHSHPGQTISTLLHGLGRFFTNTTSSPLLQPKGSVFVIPKDTPHAFGHVGAPAIVTVAWSPPFHPGYMIPAQGCVGLPQEKDAIS